MFRDSSIHDFMIDSDFLLPVTEQWERSKRIWKMYVQSQDKTLPHRKIIVVNVVINAIARLILCCVGN